MIQFVDKSDMRRCLFCGKDTNVFPWYRNYDEEGNWDKDSYLCHKCGQNRWAKTKGFKDFAHYARERSYKRGTLPMSENKKCPLYLGVYIAERKVARIILPEIFGFIKKEMPYNNHGFDFLVKDDILVDIKSSSLDYTNHWTFGIGRNKIADCFLLISFNNDVENLNIIHIWLFNKGDYIRGEEFYNRSSFSVGNDEITICILEVREITAELKSLKNVIL